MENYTIEEEQTHSENNQTQDNSGDEYNNSRKQYLLPILFALTLAIGMVLGNLLKKDSGQQQVTVNYDNQPDNKLSLILDIIDKDYVDPVDEEEIIENTIPKMLSELDPHSIYIPAEEMQEYTEPLQGNFEGIGVQFNLREDTIYVVNTIPGGPSEKVGILPGDRIVTINDSVFAGKNISNRDVMKALKGPKGSKVEVGIKRRGEKNLLDFEIFRDEIPLYSVDISYMIDDNIGYIKINKFSSTTYNEFVEGIKKLKEKGLKKLIVDLRRNSGGYLEPATDIADEFLDKGKLIVYTQGNARPKYEYFATSNDLCSEYDVAVLIDEGSASASEILAGAIQDNDRGIIIGRRSFGKGLVQQPTEFTDGSAMRLTIARYYTPTGRCIQKPYNNGSEDYYHEIIERYENGEFEERDSIHLPDSLQYETPGGNIVYGGGGIMPDIFVPLDTLGISEYFNKITRKGLIYRFALDYTDKKRQSLNKFNDYEALNRHLNGQNLLPKFVLYSEKHGVEKDALGIETSKELILLQIKAYIARNIFGNEGFYPIINQDDATVKMAINVLTK